jgi:hypothetical protein
MITWWHSAQAVKRCAVHILITPDISNRLNVYHVASWQMRATLISMYVMSVKAVTMNKYHFSVSELLPDNRVLITVYTRIDDQITVNMDVYDDPTLRARKRCLDVQVSNGLKDNKIEDDTE